MLSTADKKLAALTIVVVVGFGALSWWCYQLYEGNVAQGEALDDVQRALSREVERLDSRVASQDDTLKKLSNRVAQANDGGLRRVQQLESQMNDLGSQIDDVDVQLDALDGQISEVRGSFCNRMPTGTWDSWTTTSTHWNASCSR